MLHKKILMPQNEVIEETQTFLEVDSLVLTYSGDLTWDDRKYIFPDICEELSYKVCQKQKRVFAIIEQDLNGRPEEQISVSRVRPGRKFRSGRGFWLTRNETAVLCRIQGNDHNIFVSLQTLKRPAMTWCS